MTRRTTTKALKLFTTLAIISAVVGIGYLLHGTTAWAVAGSPPVNPTVLWGKCLTTEKPTVLTDARPGIDPKSHLYYHPKVAESPEGRSLVGWTFYGSVESQQGTETFQCETDVLGERVQWVPQVGLTE